MLYELEDFSQIRTLNLLSMVVFWVLTPVGGTLKVHTASQTGRPP
jgi:hypothetical protein